MRIEIEEHSDDMDVRKAAKVDFTPEEIEKFGKIRESNQFIKSISNLINLIYEIYKPYSDDD